VGDGHGLPSVSGADRVAVAAKRHQALRADLARRGQHRRVGPGGHRPQALRGGQLGHRGALPVRAAAEPGVADPDAEPVQACLRLRRRQLVGQRAPPALRGGQVRLLHHALAVAPTRRADRDSDRVVRRDRPERGGQPPGVGVADRGHSVEPPPVGQPAQPACHRVEGLDQVRLVLRRGQHRAPPRGVRQRPDQQMRGRAPSPRRGRIRQFEPVELGLLTRRVRNDPDVAAFHRRARLTMRAQLPRPQRPRQRRIRPAVSELDQLVVQRGRPQVRIVDQPLPRIAGERLEPVRPRRPPNPHGRLVGQIAAHRAPVDLQVPGDRRDRPTPRS
jgi:hypothetical protein